MNPVSLLPHLVYCVLYSLNNMTGVPTLELFSIVFLISMGTVQYCHYHNHHHEGKRL